MFFQSTFFSITLPSLSLSMNFLKCAVVFLGHFLDLCADGFPLLSVTFAYYLFHSPWEPGPHLSPFLLFPSCLPTDVLQRHLLEDWQVFWRQTENIREESDSSVPLKPEPCTGLGWVRSVLKATSPRTGVWGQQISEDTGNCPLLGKASSPAYLARCSWECLIVTSGSLTVACDFVLWRFLMSAVGCALKWLCALWNLAPESLILGLP